MSLYFGYIWKVWVFDHFIDKYSSFGYIDRKSDAFDKFIEFKAESDNLLGKDAKFVWDKRCQRSFEQLKQFLTTTPIVRAPKWQLPFEVMCNASDSFLIGVSTDSCPLNGP